MGSTIAQKIIAAHLVSGSMQVGEDIGLRIDQTLTQDATGTMAYLEFEAMGVPRVKTERSVAYIDHNTLQSGFETPTTTSSSSPSRRSTASTSPSPATASATSCTWSASACRARPSSARTATPPPGAASACWPLAPAAWTWPVAMGGGEYHITMPKMMKINLTGRLSPWVSAKDVILAVLQKLSVKGAWAASSSTPGRA